ncbi:MAG: hypothetical protein CVV27_02930 [Candidatus Melainabacteria bacterium HGW-Melainabacteria-1]|nr:MAG: hypothetical protein CVV27_02930 [Candidatus Melainabacteria bacterium HGW-Melainabacteria-1]
MKPLLRKNSCIAAGLGLLLLTGCDQNIRQQVNIDNGKQTELISKLVDKLTGSATPGTQASAKPATSSPSFAPGPSVSGPAPALPASSAPSQSTSEAQWLEVNFQSKEAPNNISFVDFNTGWVVGPKGMVRRTLDGGKTWEIQDTGDKNLNDVSFINASTGWVCGDYGTLRRTTDSGKTWEQLDSGVSFPIWAVRFQSPDHGIMMTTYDLYDTQDGGKTWMKRFKFVGTDRPTITYYEPQKAIISSGYYFAQYNKGAVSLFETTFSGNPGYSAALFSAPGIGWYHTNTDRGWLKTEDNAKTWVHQEKLVSDKETLREFRIADMAFANPQEGIAFVRLLPDYHSIHQYQTYDGGMTWRKSNFKFDGNMYDGEMSRFQLFTDLQHGWAILDKKLMRLSVL